MSTPLSGFARAYGSPAKHRQLKQRSASTPPQDRKPHAVKPPASFTSDYLRNRNDELETTGKVLASKNHAIAKKLSIVEGTLNEAKRTIKDLRRALSFVQMQALEKALVLPPSPHAVATQTSPSPKITPTPPPHEKANHGLRPSSGAISLSPRKTTDTATSPLMPIFESTPKKMHESIPSQSAVPSTPTAPAGSARVKSTPLLESVKFSHGNYGEAASDEEQELSELPLASSSILSPLMPKWLSPESLHQEMTNADIKTHTGHSTPTPDKTNRAQTPHFGSVARAATPVFGSPAHTSAKTLGFAPSSPPSIFADAPVSAFTKPGAAYQNKRVSPRPALTSLAGSPQVSGKDQHQSPSATSTIKPNGTKPSTLHIEVNAPSKVK